MQSPSNYFRTFTIPTGATTGKRIVLDGVGGDIEVWSAANKQVGDWGGPNGQLRLSTDINGVNPSDIIIDPTIPIINMHSAGVKVGRWRGSDGTFWVGPNLDVVANRSLVLTPDLVAADGVHFVSLHLLDNSGNLQSGINSIALSTGGTSFASTGALTSTNYVTLPNNAFGGAVKMKAPPSNTILVTFTVNWFPNNANTIVFLNPWIKNSTQNFIIWDSTVGDATVITGATVGQRYCSSFAQLFTLETPNGSTFSNEGDEILLDIQYKVSAAGSFTVDRQLQSVSPAVS